MRVLAVLLALVLLVAGCGGTDPVPKEPKKSTTATAPSATLPTMPAAATEDTEAGAIAFVKHYIDVFNYASNTGDVDELKRLSDPTCSSCRSYIDLYKKTYDDGGYFKDSDWSVSDLSVEVQSDDVVVFAKIIAPPGQFRLDSTSEEHPGKAESLEVSFVPRFGSTSWYMTEIGG